MKRRLVVLVIWVIILLALLFAPISQAHISHIWAFAHADKVVHFILFFVTGIIIIFCTKFLQSVRIRVIVGLIFGIFLAISTELVQALIPARYMSLYDFIADVSGLAAGVFLYLLIYSNKKIRSFM